MRGASLAFAAGGVDDTLLTPEPRIITDALLAYTLTRPRATFSAAHVRFREQYEESSILARDVAQSSIGMEYRFTPLLLGGVQVAYAQEDFELGDAATEERTLASLRRRLGRAWEGSLSFERSTRDRDLGGSYREHPLRTCH